MKRAELNINEKTDINSIVVIKYDKDHGDHVDKNGLGIITFSTFRKCRFSLLVLVNLILRYELYSILAEVTGVAREKN